MAESGASSAFFDACVHRAASPLSVFLARRCAEAVVDACDLNEDDDRTLLDFGCGIGLLSRELAPYCSRIVGCDASLEAVRAYNAACEDQGIAEDEMRAVHIADIASSEALQGQLFDIVVAAQVMHHISDVGRVLEALAQRLKPGGTLIVIDQLRDPATPLKPPTAVVPHRGGFTDTEITAAFAAVQALEPHGIDTAFEITAADVKRLRRQDVPAKHADRVWPYFQAVARRARPST